MAKKRVSIDLKRGAEARPNDLQQLFGGENAAERPERMRLVSVRIDHVEADPDQPRKVFEEAALKELSDSIALEGVLQPIEVIQIAKDQYRIVYGERRWRASQLAGLKKIPAIVRRRDYDEVTRFVRQMVENVQREGLNDLDRALAMVRLRDLMKEELAAAAEEGVGPWSSKATWSKVGERLGMSRQRVDQLKRLLLLPPEIQDQLRLGTLTERETRIFQRLQPQQQIDLFRARDVDQIVSKPEAVRVAGYLKAYPEDTVKEAIKAIRTDEKLEEVAVARVEGMYRQVQAVEKGIGGIAVEGLSKDEAAALRPRLERIQRKLQAILEAL